MEKLYKVRVSGMIEATGHITVKAENPQEAEVIARNSITDGVTWEPVRKTLEDLDDVAYSKFRADMSIESVEEQK